MALVKGMSHGCSGSTAHCWKLWLHNNFTLPYQPVLGAINSSSDSPAFPSQLLWLSVSSKILGSLPTMNSNCGCCCLAVKPWALGKRKKKVCRLLPGLNPLTLRSVCFSRQCLPATQSAFVAHIISSSNRDNAPISPGKHWYGKIAVTDMAAGPAYHLE